MSHLLAAKIHKKLQSLINKVPLGLWWESKSPNSLNTIPTLQLEGALILDFQTGILKIILYSYPWNILFL